MAKDLDAIERTFELVEWTLGRVESVEFGVRSGGGGCRWAALGTWTGSRGSDGSVGSLAAGAHDGRP